MKQAVSVSLGSSRRDKTVVVDLLGQQVSLSREGMEGDVERAAQRFRELDGRVDALGMGGINLWVELAGKRYPLHAAHKMVQGVHKTPVVDGSGLKNTLERHIAAFVVQHLGDEYRQAKVLLTAAVDRWGMTLSFYEQGHDIVYGDLMFGLGLPLPLRRLASLKRVGRIILPVAGRLPIHVLYPTGEKQHENEPRFTQWYDWAVIIAGDLHYIRRHMPASLAGKVIVTNTTTEQDMAEFRQRGVRAVITTTPQYQGRSFGTNLMEAALTAAAGKGRPLTHAEIAGLLDLSILTPVVHDLGG